MSSQATAQVIITHKIGLHARPSVKFTKLAKTFPCSVEIATSENGPWIDAKSIVKAVEDPKSLIGPGIWAAGSILIPTIGFLVLTVAPVGRRIGQALWPVSACHLAADQAAGGGWDHQ